MEDEHNAIVEGDVYWTEEQEDETRGTEWGRITGSTDLGLICRHNKFYK